MATGRWLKKMAERLEEAASSPEAQPNAPAAERVFPRVQRAAMGSLFEIYLVGNDRDALMGAAEEALDEITRLDRQLSHYRSESDIARINSQAATEWVRVDPDLYRLLRRCARISEATEGAFDITTQPLVRAWGFHDGQPRVPDDAEVSALLAKTGARHLLFDDTLSSVAFARPGVEIALGAIGKGHALDEAAKVLRFHGVRNAVLHGGQSTILGIGEGPDGEGWLFPLHDPTDPERTLEQVCLRDQALSTSSGSEQFFESEGERYCHILDPRTGRALQGSIKAYVVAPSAAESDAWATACCVLGAEAAAKLLAANPHIRALIVEEPRQDGDRQITRVNL
jgi:thiamine biosynthesis lipoprotein